MGRPRTAEMGNGYGVEYRGPVPGIEARFVRIEIIETVAVVHLLEQNREWKITHKAFHWY